MVENIKKINILLLLFLFLLFPLLSCKSQVEKDRDVNFYRFLDEMIKDNGEFKYLGIIALKKCNNGIIFTVNKMSYNEGDNPYKSYIYKNVPVLYLLNKDEKNQQVLNFFDTRLKHAIYDINILEKDNQSIVNGKFIYFQDEKFVDNEVLKKEFMTKRCSN